MELSNELQFDPSRWDRVEIEPDRTRGQIERGDGREWDGVVVVGAAGGQETELSASAGSRGRNMTPADAPVGAAAAGGPDASYGYQLKTTRTGHIVRWNQPEVTMHIDPKLSQRFGADVIRKAIEGSAAAWAGLPNLPSIKIDHTDAPGYDPHQRTNGIYLIKPWPFPREQLAVTVSTYDLDGPMIGADILINGESDFAALPDGDVDDPWAKHHDLQAVLTHEMGHVQGLEESPDDREATMWPYLRNGDVHQRTLSDDDKAGLAAAYKHAGGEEGLVGQVLSFFSAKD